MNDKDYYARLRKEMEKRKAAQQPPATPIEKPRRKKTVKALVGKSMSNPVASARSTTTITNDDILNIRIVAETSNDVLDFIRRI